MPAASSAGSERETGPVPPYGSSQSPHREADPVKDQTHFLSQPTAEQLPRSRFPVGDLPKAEVRRIAAERGLATDRRPEARLGECPGEIEHRRLRI